MLNGVVGDFLVRCNIFSRGLQNATERRATAEAFFYHSHTTNKLRLSFTTATIYVCKSLLERKQHFPIWSHVVVLYIVMAVLDCMFFMSL